MEFSVTCPDLLRPGQIWLVAKSDLPEELAIGTVCTATTASGREAAFLVDRTYRGRNERYYAL